MYRNITSGQTVTVTDEQEEGNFTKGKNNFLEEARTAAKFSNCKSIVDIRDFFEENDTAYIVMEYIEGITLGTYVKKYGVFGASDLINKMLPIFNALKLIHNNEMVHRDISPDNIMILKNNSLKLMDFGAARQSNFNQDKSLSIVLRRGYAPEEQYRSKGIQGPWTDIYALCATIYKCITGITPDESTERVYSDDVKPPSYYGINISPEYEAAIMKGMSVYQRDRFQNIDELLSAFSFDLNKNSDMFDDFFTTRHPIFPQDSDHSNESCSVTVSNNNNNKRGGFFNNKRKIIVLAVIITALLAVIGIIIFFIFSGFHFGNNASESTPAYALKTTNETNTETSESTEDTTSQTVSEESQTENDSDENDDDNADDNDANNAVNNNNNNNSNDNYYYNNADNNSSAINGTDSDGQQNNNDSSAYNGSDPDNGDIGGGDAGGDVGGGEDAGMPDTPDSDEEIIY